RPGLHRRRAARDPRREALAAAELRAPPRPTRRRADAAAGHPRDPRRRVIAHLQRPAAGEPESPALPIPRPRADEPALSPLLARLAPERRLLGVPPRGPLSLPPGGAHWYVVQEIGYPEPATFLPTYAALSEWLDGLGFAPERTVIGGFSQGAVMT